MFSLFFITCVSAEKIDIAPYDCYIDSKTPDVNYDNSVYLKTYSSSSQNQYSYLKFYISEYTTSATINIFVKDSYPTTDSINIVRTSPDWDESIMTWDTGRPIKDDWRLYTITSSQYTAGNWVSFDVSSVVNEPGYYSFMIKSNYGDSQTFNSTNSAANKPYMTIDTRESEVDIISNTKTNDDSSAFLVSTGDEITFSISPNNAEKIDGYNWYVNKKNQSFYSNDFNFIVPQGIENYPDSEIWEIHVDGTYSNGTTITREWLISSLSEDEAPEFIYCLYQ
jgi:hypothetical protein